MTCAQRSTFLSTLAVLLLTPVDADAAEFRPIYGEAILGGATYGVPVPYISALSGDGSTIGGTITRTGVTFDCAVSQCENSAFVYSLADGQGRLLSSVELPPQALFTSAYPRQVFALTGDGEQALVGSEARHYDTTIQSAKSVQRLRDSIVLGEDLFATAMSGNGNTIVGTIADEAFLWTIATGLQPIPGVAPESKLRPTAISGDGTRIALADLSFTRLPTLQNAVFYWTAYNLAAWDAENGLQELFPAEGNELSIVTSINYDGSVFVGASSHYEGPGTARILTATRWDGTSVVALPNVGDFDSTIATDISYDGQIIIGVARYDSPNLNLRELSELRKLDQAVLWRAGEPVLLVDLLVEKGLAADVEGWRLLSATAISDDGQVIAGRGLDPNGNLAAWVVNLRIPEPATSALLAAAWAFASFWRMRPR